MNETFRTLVSAPSNPRRIDLSHSILCVGSCFAEAIGERFAQSCFRICLNPFGSLFNPLTIAQNLGRVLAGTQFSSDELFEHEGLWHSFAHHSSFSSPDRRACLESINRAFAGVLSYVNKLDTLILTLGTAFIYVDRSSGTVVANCHKLPENRFDRLLVPIETIVQALDKLLGAVYSRRPMVNIVLTVSPVRHLRDQPHENSVSKAHLMAAVHELEGRFPALHYFPAYEIMLDELRDYRFYGDDMTHPNPVAVDYLWMRFQESCLSERSRQFVAGAHPLIQALSHRGMGRPSPLQQTFVSVMLEKTERLQKEFPEADLSVFRSHFASLAEKA